MSGEIIIIGGGISGITTALALQLLGYDTTCYAEHLVSEQAPLDPRFASLYPAASVIPHSVHTDKLDELFPVSLQIFRLLLEHKAPGIKLHRHCELYESPREDPSYAPFLQNYTRIENLKDVSLPKRPGAQRLYGWTFDCIFTEWPVYIRQLYRWYENTGGTIDHRKVERDDVSNLNTNVIINCSGVWSPKLFEDSEPLRVSRGHILHIPKAPPIKNEDGTILSYNYTPAPDVYSDPSGRACDVYCYPRYDGWILGGSRQHGILSPSAEWKGEEQKDTIELNGIQVPRPILVLNREIIKHAYGLDLQNYAHPAAKEGYRYIRSGSKSGLRLEVAHEYGKTIIHNYGHGGAGVSLSWGCALSVAAKIKTLQGDAAKGGENETELLNLFKNQLHLLFSAQLN